LYENFAELCRQLLNKLSSAMIVVIGTPDDSSLGENLKIINQSRIHNLAGKICIEHCAALLKRCSLVVGNDGGAMHLADAMGTKVVSIVPGLEYPDSIEPWHNKKLAIRHSIDCAPCYSFSSCPLQHNKCMRDIPVVVVLKKCFEALALSE